MSNTSNEQKMNSELNTWVCEELELAQATSPMDKAINDSVVS